MQNVTTASHYQYQNKSKGQSRIILKYRKKERKKERKTKIEREHLHPIKTKRKKGEIHNNSFQSIHHDYRPVISHFCMSNTFNQMRPLLLVKMEQNSIVVCQ